MTTTITAHTVGTGDDTIHYYVRGDLADRTADRPVLLLIGSPMDASGFGSLAERFADRPVVTYDPRGSGRNPTGTSPVPPELHAEDVHRVIAALDAGPVDLLGSSGGAVNALALVAAHPDDVRRVVAHEPPTAAFTEDRETVIAICEDMKATYEKSGSGAAMAKFISFVMHDGVVGPEWLEQPAPDPAVFGLSAEDDGDRSDPLMRNMPSCNTYEPDLEALRALGDRLVIAGGVESGQQFAVRGGRGVAQAVGIEHTDFPSDHGGFMDGEFGQTGDVDGFARALRVCLS